MKARTAAALAALALTALGAPAQTSIRGVVSVAGAAGGAVPLRVFAIRFHVRADGVAVAPEKDAVLAASRGDGVVTAGADGAFEVAVAPGTYGVFGFADLDRDGGWDPGGPEPFGWYAASACGGFAPVRVPAMGSGAGIELEVRAPEHFAVETRSTSHGTLRRVKGYPVLQLRGDARQRGLAHGSLVARQIVDFFRFYVLEDKLKSASDYLESFAPFLETKLRLPEAFEAECDAVIEGMQASGVDLWLEDLGRDFSRTDLLAINSYIETRAMQASCTQFAAWGDRTAGTDVDGGMVTGRNMDGECDLRKVTVSHFLLFAVEPTEPGQKRYVSMMWPGFVGTISGLNESGFYAMENAGGTGPGPVVDRLVPISWTMREALARSDGSATPESVKALCDEFANAAGGSCGPGCVMLFAVPFRGQAHPAFVYEGDRFGDAIRLPGAVRPQLADALVCSNHFLTYGADPDRPGAHSGRLPSFSSRWRYEAGLHKLEAWHRIDRKIGTADMRELLQTVAHGTTEYAIITRPNAREFDVAVASLGAEPWDAPYRAWTTYAFDDVFAAREPGGESEPGKRP